VRIATKSGEVLEESIGAKEPCSLHAFHAQDDGIETRRWVLIPLAADRERLEATGSRS
jgi:hypothetical protein